MIVFLVASPRPLVPDVVPERPLGLLRKAEELTGEKDWPEAAVAWQRLVDLNRSRATNRCEY